MDIAADQNSGSGGWRSIFEANIPLLLAIYILLAIFDGVLKDNYILTEALYYESFGDRMDFERIADWNQWRHDWGWVSYLTIPLVMFVRIGFAAMCMNIGSLFAGYKFPFAKFLRIAAVSEGVFAVMLLFNTGSFIMTHDITNLDYDLNDIYLHHPASLLGLARVLFEGEVISAYFLAVLQGINLFEVLYIIALSLGVMALFDFKFGKSIKFVLGSYGIGFLMWIVTLMFLMVTMARVQ